MGGFEDNKVDPTDLILETVVGADVYINRVELSVPVATAHAAINLSSWPTKVCSVRKVGPSMLHST